MNNLPSSSFFEFSEEEGEEEGEEEEENFPLNKEYSWFSQENESTYQRGQEKISLDSNLYSSTPLPEQQKNENLDYRFTISTFKSGIPTHSREAIDAKIAEWSKGSAFYENEKRKSTLHESKIRKLLQQVEKIKKSELESKEMEIENWITELETKRKTDSFIVLMDLDAFYASVEERDMPELKTKPMAVGDISMLSTSNYIARKYGVRSGMPGYIAKKLCPELIIIPLHFEKYKAISQQVFSIQKRYDPDVQSWGLDESYLNLTEYMKLHPEKKVDDVVNEIRMRIFEGVQVTASAGIACNRLLAKICADINKPNGQYRLESERNTILSFLSSLPIRKVFGVGRVMEHTLKALSVCTCSDFLEKKALLSLVLSKKTFSFLLMACLGISNNEEIDTDGFPKSISSERTIQPTNDIPALMSILASISEDVASELKRKGWVAKQITLKCKSIHFRVKQMGQLQRTYMQSATDLFNKASAFLLPLLSALDAPLRLIGIRVSSLKLEADSQKQLLPAFFGNVVNCPVCQKSFHETDINEHLDLCLFLSSSSDSSLLTTSKEVKNQSHKSLNQDKQRFELNLSFSNKAKKTNKKRKQSPISQSLHSFLKPKLACSMNEAINNDESTKEQERGDDNTG